MQKQKLGGSSLKNERQEKKKKLQGFGEVTIDVLKGYLLVNSSWRLNTEVHICLHIGDCETIMVL